MIIANFDRTPIHSWHQHWNWNRSQTKPVYQVETPLPWPRPLFLTSDVSLECPHGKWSFSGEWEQFCRSWCHQRLVS